MFTLALCSETFGFGSERRFVALNFTHSSTSLYSATETNFLQTIRLAAAFNHWSWHFLPTLTSAYSITLNIDIIASTQAVSLCCMLSLGLCFGNVCVWKYVEVRGVEFRTFLVPRTPPPKRNYSKSINSVRCLLTLGLCLNTFGFGSARMFVERNFAQSSTSS